MSTKVVTSYVISCTSLCYQILIILRFVQVLSMNMVGRINQINHFLGSTLRVIDDEHTGGSMNLGP